MQSAFGSAFEDAFSEAYGDESISPYSILYENLDAITDELGNVIEEEF
jgi:hypothetical protein